MKYYKHYAESILGEGIAYLEVRSNGYAIRQIEIYGKNAFWADEKNQKDDRFILADQYIGYMGTEYEITPKEFEQLWKEANSGQIYEG